MMTLRKGIIVTCWSQWILDEELAESDDFNETPVFVLKVSRPSVDVLLIVRRNKSVLNPQLRKFQKLGFLKESWK